MEGEQIHNPGFESCDLDVPTWDNNRAAWVYNDSGNTDLNLTGITTDTANTGTQSFQFVFGVGGGSFGIELGGTHGTCPERNYKYSFYAKQLTAGVCVVQQWLMGVEWRDFTLPADGTWGYNEVIMFNPFATTGNNIIGGPFELRVVCTAGGQANTVYIDDVSFAYYSDYVL